MARLQTLISSPLFKAFKETLFQLAFIHFVLLLIQSLLTGNILLFNTFSILDLSFFMPEFIPTVVNTLVLSLPIILIFLFNLKKSQKMK